MPEYLPPTLICRPALSGKMILAAQNTSDLGCIIRHALSKSWTRLRSSSAPPVEFSNLTGDQFRHEAKTPYNRVPCPSLLKECHFVIDADSSDERDDDATRQGTVRKQLKYTWIHEGLTQELMENKVFSEKTGKWSQDSSHPETAQKISRLFRTIRQRMVSVLRNTQ